MENIPGNSPNNFNNLGRNIHSI